MKINEEIDKILQVWPEFSITPNDFHEPTSYIATEFYEKFVCDLLKFRLDDIKQPIISNTTLPHDLLHYCVLCSCMNTVINQLDVQSMIQYFGLIDLLNPTRKTFKIRILYFIQVMLFGQDILETITAAQCKVVNDLAEINELKSTIDVFNEKRNSTIHTIEKIIDRKEDWGRDKENLLKSIETKEETIHELKNENRKKKNILLNHNTEYQKFEQELLRLTALREGLEAEVVDDYKSILLEREQLEKNKEGFLLAWTTTSQAMDKKIETITTISNINKITAEFIESMDFNKILEKYALLQDLGNTFNQVSEELEILKSNKERPQKFKEEMLNVREKKQALILKADMRLKNFDEDIAKYVIELEEAVSTFKKQEHLMESCDKKISQAVSNNEKYRKNIEVQNDFYRQLYKRILESKSKLDNDVINIKQNIKY